MTDATVQNIPKFRASAMRPICQPIFDMLNRLCIYFANGPVGASLL